MFRTVWIVSFFALLALGGCKATKPNAVEVRMLNGAKHRMLVGNKKEKNPLTASAQTIADGKEAFSHY